MSEGNLKLPDPANLPDDPTVLKEIIAQLVQMNAELRARQDKLTAEVAQLRRMHYGPRSERGGPDPDQALMPFATQSFPAHLPPPGTPPRSTSAVAIKPDVEKDAETNGHGRQRLPAHLKRVPIVHDVPEEEKRCTSCRKALVKIGEDTSEQLEYTRSQMHVLKHIRPKYACPDECEECGIVIAPPPSGPIQKGLPGPALLAHVIVSKYDDHLPLYRQQEIFARQGVHISRQTMCDWVAAAADLLEPLVLLMKRRVLLSKKIHTDDIPVPVQDETRDKTTREARLWGYIGDDGERYVVFDYSPNHAQIYPMEFLKDFTKYLQCDAYAGYANLRAILVGCWAHARRRFFDAQTTDPARAAVALVFIRRLYAVEDQAKDLDGAARRRLRQEHSKQAIDELKAWLDREELSVLPQSAMGEAFTYVRNQWDRLTRYLDDGDLDIDNNIAERVLRGVAIGRKNWLFAGSDEGGKRAAIAYSVIETCKLQGVEPLSYLTDVLARIATHPARSLEELLPGRWRPPPRAP